MAVRVLALLIPLAITLPQLQTTRPQAPAPQYFALPVQPAAAEPTWSYETRRQADAAITRVVLDSPAQEAVRMISSPVTITSDDAAAADMAPQVRKAPSRRTAPKFARAAQTPKPTGLRATADRSAARRAKAAEADTAGCAPDVHCAPVVVAKITPVLRRPM
jgi:hypothetical protein